MTTGVDMENFITPKECFQSDLEDEWDDTMDVHDDTNDGNERNREEPRNIFELSIRRRRVVNYILLGFAFINNVHKLEHFKYCPFSRPKLF